MGTSSVLNISAPLIFAFHSKLWKGKVTKCMFTQSTQPAHPQLSPNLVLLSFSGLAGKYRFSCYSRHIIYLIKCVFWHVHYLPDGLTDGREQTLSFVQTATLFVRDESSILPCPLQLRFLQRAPPACHGGAKSERRRGEARLRNRRVGGTWCDEALAQSHQQRGQLSGMDCASLYSNVCVYI